MSENFDKEACHKQANNDNHVEEHKLFSDDIRERQKKQRRLAALWPTLSLILHLIGFALLVIFTPLREIIIPEKKENSPSQLSRLSEEELQDIAEEVEEARENEISKYLEELQTVLHNMEFMKNELLKDYDEMAQQEAEEVKSEMEQLFEAVLEQQELSLENQQESEAFIEELADMQEQAVEQEDSQEIAQEVTENEQSFKDAEQAQAIAQNLLDVIAAKAEITGMEKTTKAAQTAFKTQQEINALQAESKQLVWNLRKDNELINDNYEEQKKEAEKFENEYKPNREKAEKTLEEKTQEKEKSAQELAQAEQQKQEAEKQRNEANQQSNNANNELNKARNERNQAENDARNKDNEAKKRQDELKASKDKTAKAERELETAKKAEADKQQKLDKANQELAQAQQNKQEAEKNNEANKNALNDANNKLNEAKRSAENAKNELKRANEATKNRERELSEAQKNQQNNQERVAQAQANLEEAKKAESEKQQGVDKANQELAQAEKNKQEAEKNSNASKNALNDANKKQENAKRTADQAKQEHHRASETAKARERDLASEKKLDEQREKMLAEAQQKQADAKQKFEEKKEQYNAAEQAQKAAQKTRNEAESNLRQKNDQLNSARQKDRNAQIALSNAERDLNHKKSQEERSKKYTEELQAKKDELVKAAAEKAKLLDAKDNKASEAQKALMEMVKSVAQLAASEAAQPEPFADPTMESPELANTMLSRLPLSEAYDKAKELEHQIAERNRDIKATELAISQKMPLSQAIEMTDVAKTLRPEFDKSLLESDPSTEQEFLDKREEMTKVVREAENISAVAKSVMAEAEVMVFPDRYNSNYSKGGSMSREERLSRMYEFSDMANEIKEAGSEDSSQQAKDLSSMMAEADARMGSQNGQGTSQQFAQSSMSPATSNSQGNNSRGGNPNAVYGGRASNAGSSKWIPTKLSAEDMTGVKGLSEKGVRGGTAEGMGVPALKRGMEGLVTGNFIGGEGRPAKWARISNWYIIGPFANPNRVNLTRKFAPESKVDLDATYVGKDGKILKWEYNAYNLHGNAEIRPWSQDQYGIWYAYTEVFMEEEGDYWVAVGSDDRMDVWINDYKVWSSTNELKYWRINEGFRKVHLRRGRNTILTRIENGWYVISWSMFITLPEE